MNRKQRVVVIIGIIALSMVWIYPSWRYTFELPNESFETWAGYYWLFSPPMPYGVRLHVSLLLAESLLVLLIFGGLCRAVRDRRSQHGSEKTSRPGS